MTVMALSRIHFPVTTLGPGRRVGVWFQGCSIRCPGCISVDTWDPMLGQIAIADIERHLKGWAALADGLTVSGGEPFDQPAALNLLLRLWRVLSPAAILLFTGYDLAAVAPWLEAHPGLVDAIVTGPYEKGMPQTRALRGSDNQELHILTIRGEPLRAYERPRTAEDRRLDVMFDEDGGAWFAGIPEPDDFRRFRDALAAAGHRTSMAKAHPE